MENASVSTLSLGSATHAAKRAADIVFVLGNKNQLDDVALVDRLNEVLVAYGERKPDVEVSDLNTMRAVATRLHALFETQRVEDAATILNALLNDYARTPRLSAHGGSPWHVHVDQPDVSWAAWFAASSAMGLAILLAEKQRNPGGLCASSRCGRPFIDLGKGGGRSYCSPRCATRERVAAFRKQAN